MEEIVETGLEVAPCPGPEIAQTDADKYFIKAEEARNYSFDQPIQSSDPDARSQGWRKAFWVIALVAILCLAVALGVGLGVGLAAQHRLIPPSGLATSSPIPSSSVITTTQSARVITMTSSPSTNPSTQAGKVLTITATPSSPATMPSPVCPADDGSTYTATNKPWPTAGPLVEIANTSLSYQIFCYTNFIANPPVMDLQTLTNVTSLLDCLDACALYSFQTKPINFPGSACTGIAWSRVASATQLCWLKSNVTSSSTNATNIYPGIDGAVMVLT
ncbi:MAG: hypothetical protein ASARMPREDX12_001245 [Alectoria sarmentosa]|nr:MAG: hypothetical protein ASARMPREDX12_001245 [Alectoria sarmentosa]